MTRSTAIPDHALAIVDTIARRHGFMADEIIGKDMGEEASAARRNASAALASRYSDMEIEAWLSGRPHRERVELLEVDQEAPGAAMVFSLWRGPIAREVRRCTMDEIADEVAMTYGTTVDALKGPERDRAHSIPRQHAMWLMDREGHSLTAIGHFLAGRDHTTALHGVRAHAARLAAEWSGRAVA
jgi:hypothetical protein